MFLYHYHYHYHYCHYHYCHYIIINTITTALYYNNDILIQNHYNNDNGNDNNNNDNDNDNDSGISRQFAQLIIFSILLVYYAKEDLIDSDKLMTIIIRTIIIMSLVIKVIVIVIVMG